MQIVQTLIRRRILWRLIWVYTVNQSPFYGTLVLNASRKHTYIIFTPLNPTFIW